MVNGAQKAAPPENVAKVILRAANDPSDRLRYAAIDAVAALRLRRLLPDQAWRKMLSRSFGLQPGR